MVPVTEEKAVKTEEPTQVKMEEAGEAVKTEQVVKTEEPAPVLKVEATAGEIPVTETKEKISSISSAPAAEKLVVFSETQNAQILRQVEFYFSESNLPRDRFLLERLAEGDGLVSLELICTFAKMRPLVGLTDANEKPKPAALKAVAAVLKQSQSLKLSEDESRIGRVSALDMEAARGELERRSLLCSPLPYNASMSDIEKEFGKYGQVKSVRMRRHVSSKDFNGSVFIEFSSEEEAEKVIKMEVVAFGANQKMQKRADLEKETGKDVDEGADPTAPSPQTGVKRKQPEESDHPLGVLVAIQVTKKGVAGAQGAGEATGEGKTEVEMGEGSAVQGEEGEGEKGGEKEGEQEGEKEVEKEEKEGEKDGERRPKYGPAAGEIGREQLKDAFSAFGQVRYIDYKYGDTSGFIRFETADEAKAALERGAEGVPIADTHTVTVRAVEGEEEKAYWENVKASQDKRKSFDRGGRGGGRFGRGGGRFGGRGGGGGNNFRGRGRGRGRGRN